MENSKTHIALLASPGMGHLIPVLELAKSFVSFHGFQVTVIVVATDVATSQSFLKSLEHNLSIITLPLVDVSGLVDPSSSVVTKLAVTMRQSLPILRSTISEMKFRPTALIVDLFGTESMAVADEFGMLKYVFVTTNAWLLAFNVYIPIAHAKMEAGNEHAKRAKEFRIPGCKSVPLETPVEAFLGRDDQEFVEFKRTGTGIAMANGILVNTWEDLELKTFEALRNMKMFDNAKRTEVYPIGPLTRPVDQSLAPRDKAVMEWLNKQPEESVIYVSFGSGGTLSTEQMVELALGLEMSQQRFVWVVRPPSENDASRSFFLLESDSHQSFSYFPDGFLNRTRDRGVIVPTWAPQAEILAHPCVGGFLSHCGWNSILESIVNGVPMIAWPLYAEQKMNATLLTEELGMAIGPETSLTDRVVGRKEIEKMVRMIMVGKEGHALRKRVKDLRDSSEKAIKKGGSSYESLSKVARDCETSLQSVRAKGQGA
ncbi:hypothetical protein K2173_021377 [Erythroxylum novogranatense]|uniref:Glycosyltransferase n=1 Tax=Erythroxylum novogranatense TaxID=1862640 RepID=A0AAV8TY07_9ROSI|nr:hypothetical protein K2173_021377 [Erythroxylum novogranatense]